MAKGDVKHDIDVVSGSVPSNGANFFENAGIESTGKPIEDGYSNRETNPNKPETFSKSQVPSGYKVGGQNG